jgi:prolyl 4-hydroxylase
VTDDEAGRIVRVVDGFLDDAECAGIRAELSFAWWRDSVVINQDRLGDIIAFRSGSRQSSTAHQDYFPDQLRPVLAELEDRICDAESLDRINLESWQAIRYPVGGHFDLHHDGGLFGHEPAGERRTTVLIYLDTPAEGGETEFPDLDLVVQSRAGRMVTWDNLRPDGTIDRRLRHRARPVLAGHKTVLTTWERERPIRSPVGRPSTRGERA